MEDILAGILSGLIMPLWNWFRRLFENTGNSITSPKKPVIALLLNLFLAGGGYLYIGQIAKGLVTISVTLLLMSFCGIGIFIPIFTCIDGYKLARRLTNGQAVDQWNFFWNQPVPKNQTETADTKELFLKLRSRVTKVGALAGLTGAFVGVQVVGFALESIVQVQFNNSFNDASPFAFIAAFLVCSGYPLIGLAVGALIGRLSVKHDEYLESDRAVSRHLIIGGGIAGLAVGILPYMLFWFWANSQK